MIPRFWRSQKSLLSLKYMQLSHSTLHKNVQDIQSV